MTETARSDRLAAVASRRSSAPAWARHAGSVAGVLLGAVLLYSAWGKALDAAGVGTIYARKGLMPAGFATAIVTAAVALEAALGAALVVNLRRKIVLLGATLLMAGFFGLTLYEFLFPAPDASNCGCFGNLVVRTPGQALAGDGAFLVLALVAWLGRPRVRRANARWLLPVAGLVAALGLSIAAPRLPVDDLATRLKPGTRVASLGIDEVVPELQRGRSVVLLIDRADPATRAAMERINRNLALPPDRKVQVFGLAEENEELAAEFTWTAAPAFEVRGAPFMTLKPLYRRLPRTFLVEDGVVRRTWEGLPDDATLEALAAGKTP